MTPEDRIRMLMEENAMLRAQLQGGSPYREYQGPAGIPNAHGVTPEEYRADMDEAEAAAAASYMGNGMSDLMYRTPPRPSQAMRKERPTPYFRKEGKKPSGRSVGID